MRYLFLWDMMQWFPTFQDNVAVQPSKLKSPSSSVANILILEDEITMHSSVTVTKKKKADLDRPYSAPVTWLTTFQTLATSFQDPTHIKMNCLTVTYNEKCCDTETYLYYMHNLWHINIPYVCTKI